MLNTVCVMGRLGSDPELRYTQSGIAVTSFNIAVDRTFQPKGQDKITDWITIVAWRGTAEFVTKYFRKGSMIVVNGSIQTRNYTDRDGNNRKAVEVVANNVFFGESKRDAGNANVNYDSQTSDNQQGFSTAGADDFEEIVGDDELPF